MKRREFMKAKMAGRFRHIFVITLVLTLACNFISGQTPAAPSQPGQQPPPAGLASPPPAMTLIAQVFTPTSAVTHLTTPEDVSPGGNFNYDVESSGTAAEHRAPYGDSYRLNLFERPFTQSVMDYLPELDIVTFRLSQDSNWDYVFIELVGGDMNSQIVVDYGVEIDQDRDGHGDILVWAQPPYTTGWSTNTVRVYTDSNNDTGGASPEKSDAPFPGDGYDTIVFDQGQGNDSDLAWVRLDPHTPSSVQFAFKRTLPGNSFMWGVWADAGLRDPAKFNYNDRFTEAEAGSPEVNEKDYPIKAVSQVDDTCWVPIGFVPNGYEPHLCPPLEPPSTKSAKPTSTPFIIYFNPCLINPELCLPAPP